MKLAICLQNLFDCSLPVEACFTFGVLGFFYFFCRKIVKMGGRGPLKKIFIPEGNWERILLKPIKWLFVVLVFYYAALLLAKYFGCMELLQGFKPFKNSLITLILAWMAYQWQNEVLFVKLAKEQSLLPALNKIFSIFLVILTTLIILRIFNVDILPLIAFGGIGAAVLGFAAKDVMSSLLGGMQLSITRSFSIGDFIIIPDQKIEGFVEDIGWSLTLIRDREKCAVYLPNSLFSNFFIVNTSRRTGRRILEVFHLRFSDFHKVPLIIEDLKELLQKSKVVDVKSPILVFVSEIGKYSIDFSIDLYTMQVSLAQYVVAKEEVLKLVFIAIERRGAQVAYPVSLTEAPSFLGGS